MNFYLLTVEQFKWQKTERDPNLSTMLAAPRLFTIGDDQALSELQLRGHRQKSERLRL